MLILIAGITGMVGQPVAHAAIAQGYSVRGLSRNADKLDEGISSQLESFVTCRDYFDTEAYAKAVQGVDVVIAALPTVPSIVGAGQLALLLEAEKAGVKVFHAASWNFDWTKLNFGDHETYDAYMSFKRLAELSSGLKPVFAFCGAILEYTFINCKKDGRSPAINAETKTVSYGGTGEVKMSFISADDLAKYTIAAIDDPEIIKRGFYYVESFRYNVLEFADEYGRVRNMDIKKNHVGGQAELQGMLAQARQFISPVESNKYIDLAYGIAVLKGTALADPSDCKRWETVTRTSFEQWLNEHPEV
ncbi:isoflavone reductase like [Fusarium longipes]|uniref:Isoflavone reductase like n=1 Tax=Fusarium longipes TaxID=694270 RepID=A0A395SR42_9HYPO|nr:isoflavone reductase like [Fusarium longipes]